jgi:hypothetical protein
MNNFLIKILDLIARFARFDRYIDEIKINQGRILASLNRANRFEQISDYEFKVFSQWGEDGIIQHLISHLDISDHTFIEFGVEDFSESNCRFLLMKDFWKGFVIDGSKKNINRLRSSYYFWRYPLAAQATFITRENVIEVLQLSGFGTQPGLLSIDLDGIDWYVLFELRNWRPKILVVEYNDIFGFDLSVSVPYDPSFVRNNAHHSNLYWGASLPAFVHLASQMGLALVGVNKAGSNAFFVQRKLLNEFIKETALQACMGAASFSDSRDAHGDLTFQRGASRREIIADMPLVDVVTGATLLVGELT